MGHGGPYSSTPLHYAALEGQTEAVRTLLECGAEVNARNRVEWTPLLHGATKGSTARSNYFSITAL
ncbi:hypothetical protein F5B18DRAFT_629934, partial [Nemania serpens]